MLHITEASICHHWMERISDIFRKQSVIPLVQESPAGKATKEPEACSEHKFHNSTDFKIKQLCSFYDAVCSLMVDNGYCDVLAITNILTDIHNH